MYADGVGGEPQEPHLHTLLRDRAMNRFESVPVTWDDVRDGQFFRIVQNLLHPRLVEGASCLLSANDPELAPTP
jgi:hypothetical protein